MKTDEILDWIGKADTWLAATVVGQAFGDRDAVAPAMLDAIDQCAEAKQRLAARTLRMSLFGVFFLAQLRDRRLFEPLLRLVESADPKPGVDSLYYGRLYFFGHRLFAGACPLIMS
jgi:hypothetical protein